ncbi:CarboxypepD_reg-like domain-containing protein [Tangfeifania diversioriginum]|uniref:CarboxypepD_reg-like domain-containing protein n=1 Tax=Tangfeifania diversioriginum TaxID=1168035 RepID=A0A1M6KG25_9BACT|nr:carboxypeptidase-like regulatory domain-containing protein [Tangfeifania diversioriginum]SHJ57916.1 CarboxypepD_reg-like domain-containing protein [Tangfeifania diversioriginum]
MTKTNLFFLYQKFMRITLLLFLVLHANTSYAQWLKFVGSVVDIETNQPIPYANISVFNMPVGTCTNSYGDFMLNLPDSLARDRLDISCIGYKSRSLPIDSLIGNDTLLFLLEPKAYQIEDVVVVPGENDVHSLIKNVISKINNNYSRRKYFLEAFFRHRVYNIKENNRTVRLSEAAVSIHQNHYSDDRKKVQINEIRNSNNYAELSTSAGQKLLYTALGGNQNPIYRSLKVERLAQKRFLRKLSKNKHYSVSLKDISFFDDALMYVIEFKQESWEFLFKKYYTTHTYRKYRYYVNANDFAILKAEDIDISYNSQMIGMKNDSVGRNDFIQYRKFDEKYYPTYVHFYGMIPDMVAKNDTANFYMHEADLMVNEIARRRRDYDRIKSRNIMNKNTTLWDLEYEYNPEFWENYNLLLDHPLNPEYKKDLEFEEPLDKQFKQETHVKSRN